MPNQPLLDARVKTAFIVWGPPSHGPRSRVLARELGIPDLHFIHADSRRGTISALRRYPAQALETWRVLKRAQPQVIFVQSPPSFAVLTVWAFARRFGAQYVVDAHSAAFQHWFWMRPRWLWRLLARDAALTMVTNEHFEKMIRDAGGDALVVHDIPTTFEWNAAYPLGSTFNLAVVNTYAPDEPLSEILRAAESVPEIHFHITGKCKNAPREIMAQLPPNVQLTDFLPDATYYGLLARADAVMCLSTRDHTMQRGACEALSLGKPIITSDWALLREYFHQGTVHVKNNAADIQRGVLEMRAHHAQYRNEISRMQDAQQNEWQTKRQELRARLQAAPAEKNPPSRIETAQGAEL